jgi:uncharacterized membrane protein (UPF0127 family)
VGDQAHPPDAKTSELYHARQMRFAIFAALALICAACADGNGDSPPTPTGASRTANPHPAISPQPQLPVIELSYRDGAFQVEVADTAETRARGLSGRMSMAEDAGMLFDLGETRIPQFSMRGMLFPLDFVWIGEDRRILQITRDVQPDPDPSQPAAYSPDEPVRYVLELNAGAAARAGMGVGDQLFFELSDDGGG